MVHNIILLDAIYWYWCVQKPSGGYFFNKVITTYFVLT